MPKGRFVTLMASMAAHYRRHLMQAVFLLTGIVIANVLLVATLLINAQSRSSMAQGERLLDHQITGTIRPSNGQTTLAEQDYIKLRLSGISNIAPVLRAFVRTPTGQSLEVMGIDPLSLPTNARVTSTTINTNGFSPLLAPPYATLLAPARLAGLDISSGQAIALTANRSLPPAQAVDGVNLGHRLLTDLGSLQLATDQPGVLSYIAVFASSDTTMQTIIAALPEHLQYVPAKTALDQTALTRSFHLNLSAMGLLTFVVGTFLIYNAVAFSAVDRRHTIRMVRLMGVSRRQLGMLLSLELLIFGVVGALMGYLLGAALAKALLPGVGQTLAQLYDVYITYPDSLIGSRWYAPLVLTAVALTTAALKPLRRTLSTPLYAAESMANTARRQIRRDLHMLILGLVCLSSAAWISVYATQLLMALSALALLLLGVAFSLPWVLGLLLRGLTRFVSRESALGHWLLTDSRQLLGPAALALMAMTLALTANSGLNTMISSFRAATETWLDQRLVADWYVTTTDQPAIRAWLDQNAHTDVALAPRLQVVRNVTNPLGHSTKLEVNAVPNLPAFMNSVELFQAAPQAQEKFRIGQGVFLSERAWRLDGWRLQQRIAVCQNGPQLPIVGFYRLYGDPLPQMLVPESLYRQCWPNQPPGGIALLADNHPNWSTLVPALSQEFGWLPDQVIDQQALKALGLSVFDRTFAVTRVLNTLTLLVAGIGIFCAISAIHHHRRRSQALLVTLGVSRRRRFALLCGQWSVFALLCVVVVIPFGWLLAGVLSHVVTPIAFGWSFPLVLDWTHYPILLATAWVGVMLAVLVPNWRLLNTNVSSLLQEAA